ncbi:MAG: hypothetical protein R2779_04820, partial [Crocinitomicaceae bacterium]
MKYFFKTSTPFHSILAFFVILFLYSTSFSQDQKSITIKWSEPLQQEVNGIVTSLPNFEGQIYAEGEIYYQFIEEVAPKYDANLTLVDVQTGSATEKEIAYLKNNNISIPTQAKWKAKVTNGGKKRLLLFSIVPYIQKDGKIQRITSFTFNQQQIATFSANKVKSFASESVLKPGSGEWFKIGVTQDGIYKISKQF